MKKIINDHAKQKVDTDKLTNKVDENKDIYNLPNGPYTVPYVNKDKEICNIAVNITDSWAKAFEYARNSSFAFNGQCIVILYEMPFCDEHNNVMHGNYSPTVYRINNPGPTTRLDYLGKVLTYKNDILKPKSGILKGELCTYNYEDYFYDGLTWKPLMTKSYINTDNINTVDDIIKSFDDLQQRATELGYPIKLFTKSRPIHPCNSMDVKLTLTYDSSCPDAILAAVNVKETIDYIMNSYGGNDNE